MRRTCRLLSSVLLLATLSAACRATGTPMNSDPATPTSKGSPSTSVLTPTSVPTVVPSPTATEVTTEGEEESSDPAGDVPAWSDDRETYKPGLIEPAHGVLDELPGATVYLMDVEISEDRTRVQGHQAVHYTNREEVALGDVYFRLFPNVSGGAAAVSATMVDGQPVVPALEMEDSALRIPLPEPLEPGESAVFEMDFSVTVPTDLGGNFGLFGYTDGVLALDEFYPVIAVYDDEGWNVEVPDGIGDLTHLDASFYRVTVSAPEELALVASGVAESAQTADGRQVVTFVAGPARDFYMAASDQYELLSATVGETTVNSYAFPEHAEGSELALEVASEALRAFNERLGPYPYSELDVFAMPMHALGIEYPGAIGMALFLYEPGATVAGLPAWVLLESATAHEVGHQWFYNVVGNDQVDDPWLDEAVVQYLTYLYYVDRYGEEAAQGYRDSWVSSWERTGRAEIPIGLPAGEYDPSEYGPIVYGRGPLFVEALAAEMGEEAFSAFLRDYYNANLWSIGTPENFQDLAESHCACDLDGLFAEWVYPP